MGRRFNQTECCCSTENLYQFDAAYTPTATNDRFDVGAHFISLRRPLRGQGADIYYVNPPTGYEFESVARVRLFDDAEIEAKLTAKLIPRNMPASWFPKTVLNYDAQKTYTFTNAISGITYSNLLYGGSATTYALDVNEAPAPAFIVEYVYSGHTYHAKISAWSGLPEPSDVSSSAIDEVPLSSLVTAEREGLGGIVLYSQDMQLQTAIYGSLGFMYDGGWITSEKPNSHPQSNFNLPMKTNGYDSSFFLEFAGSSRWVNYNTNDSPRRYDSGAGYSLRPAGVAADSAQPGRRSLAVMTVQIGSYIGEACPGDVTETGYFTAYVFRPYYEPYRIATGRYRYTTAAPHNDFRVFKDSSTSGYADASYTNVGISHFNGNDVTVYRNGVQVLKAVRPTPAQSAAVGYQEGTYFVIDEAIGATEDQSVPDWFTVWDLLHKQYGCVVVDKTKPVVAFEPFDDFFGSANTNYGFYSTTLATEPLRGHEIFDVDEKGIYVAGVYGQEPYKQVLDGRTFRLYPSRYSVNTSGVFNSVALNDLAGNAPENIMTHDLKVWPYPTSYYMTGAKPSLQKFERRTRSQSEKIETVRLRFDRKINPAGVSASQITLKKNNQPVAGCTIDPVGVGDYEWIIKVPAEVQTSRSFFLLEYNPGENVYTDDIETERYISRASFPTVGRYKTKYVYADKKNGDLWFSWSTSGYVSIGANDYPLVPGGGNYAPESNNLVARTAWVMADANGRPMLIKCDSGSSWIGRCASIGFQKSFDTTKTTSEAQSNEPGMPVVQTTWPFGSQYGRVEEILYKPKQNRRGYIPCVPPPTSPRAGHSYFGLSYTIDPCPPAEVSACASPIEHQRHSSAIISDDEINSFKVSIEQRDGAGSIVTDFAAIKQPIAGDPNDFGDLSISRQQPRYAASILAREGIEYDFTAQLNGRPLSQNLWMHKSASGGTGALYETKEAQTRQPETCGIDGQKYYLVNMTDNFGTTPMRGQAMKRVRKVRATYERDGMQATIAADRKVRVYPYLKTVTLFNLALTFSFRVAVKRTTYYKDLEMQGAPIGWRRPYGGSICPDDLINPTPGGFYDFFNQSNQAVYAESQLVETGSRSLVTRFFDHIQGTIWLSKLDEISLGQGNTIRKELFLDSGGGGYTTIWTVKIRKG
jgi:hypothetical protein